MVALPPGDISIFGGRLNDDVEHPDVGADALAFYLAPNDGSALSEDAPTSSDPLGSRTTVVEREDSAASAQMQRTLPLPATSIRRDDAFFLYLAHREPLAGLPREFGTYVDVFLERCPADPFTGEVRPCGAGTRVKDANGDDWSLARAYVTYRHDGGDVDRAEGWTDIRLDATTTGAPAPASGIVVTPDAIHLPSGYTLVLFFGLLSSLDDPPGLTQPIADAFRQEIDAIDDSNVLPETAEGIVTCPPVAPTPICPVANVLIENIRVEDNVLGEDRPAGEGGVREPVRIWLSQLDRTVGLSSEEPASSYRAGSIEAPSRLEVRLA